MVKLTAEIKETMSKVKTFPLATASAKGIPNVVPVGALMLQPDDETVWIVDNYMGKSLNNVKENPNVSFYVWSPEAENSYQIKGTVTVESSGKDYETAREIMKTKRKELPAKTLLKIRITDVYCIKPGPNAGKKLL